ncbi:MAG: magnesium-translocating P-type ATPase [Vulcanimicrobiaceae bacterium]
MPRSREIGGIAIAFAAAALQGLTPSEAAHRLRTYGPNLLRGQRSPLLAILLRQFANPILLLLAVVAGLSMLLGEHTDAAIVLCIVSLSVGLSTFNEYRSSSVVADLQARLTPQAIVIRDGIAQRIDVAGLVPGDVVRIELGDIVPADLRLIVADNAACNEAALSGESQASEKRAADFAYMGTVVASGYAIGEVTATGMRTQLGRLAGETAHISPQTAFQCGLQHFSGLLATITAIVVTAVLIVSTFLVHRSVWESLLFALAIAVSLTPQLLPAIVSVSLAIGARRMAVGGVIVKHLISIEDIGNVEVLFTDKTGTLTAGRTAFASAVDGAGRPSERSYVYGLACGSLLPGENVLIGANILDLALWERVDPAARSAVTKLHRLADLPFDYERRMISILADDASTGRRIIITKGAPESVLHRCRGDTAAAQSVLETKLDAGLRILAVASREMGSTQSTLELGDERDLDLTGFLLFDDPIKSDAAISIERLRGLGVAVKILTGDNERVARKVCEQLGLPVGAILTGDRIDALSDLDLKAALSQTGIFARTSPTQKSRIIRLQRALDVDVGYLGDGINDAGALREADVGISVDSATDVARDAADIIMVTKDLGVLASGITEGRTIFANTVKYVLMATSSNFGNMISTAIGSMILPFLPMLPSQVLLNNLLYDVSEMTIPTDNVDSDQLQRPARWDMRLVRRFMAVFGPINACFDFSMFAFMLFVLHLSPPAFRTGFFIESFTTQTFIVLALRTRRPIFASRPSVPLAVTTLVCVAIGLVLPFSPLARIFSFTPLPDTAIAAVGCMIVAYIVLLEGVKRLFFSPRGLRSAFQRATYT